MYQVQLFKKYITLSNWGWQATLFVHYIFVLLTVWYNYFLVSRRNGRTVLVSFATWSVSNIHAYNANIYRSLLSWLSVGFLCTVESILSQNQLEVTAVHCAYKAGVYLQVQSQISVARQQLFSSFSWDSTGEVGCKEIPLPDTSALATPWHSPCYFNNLSNLLWMYNKLGSLFGLSPGNFLLLVTN